MATAPLNRKPRILLRYGWQDNLQLVLRLKDDLSREGSGGGRPATAIGGGDAFAAEIEDGIRGADVVSRLWGRTRRAARATPQRDRRDSICHREMSMAEVVKGHGRTVP